MKLKNYLFPTEQNGYRPFITSPLAFAIFSLSAFGLRIFLPISFSFASSSIDSADVMRLINEERTGRNMVGLKTDERLIAAASIKSNDMLEKNYFSHTDPSGQYVWPIVEAQGYKPYKALGENLAMDFRDAKAMVTAWMNSPTHRSNILNEAFEEQGVSSAYGLYEPSRYSTLTTSLFGALIKGTGTSAPLTEAPAEQTQTPPSQPTEPPAQTIKTPPVQIPVKTVSSPPQSPTEPEPSNEPALTISNDLRVFVETSGNGSLVKIEAEVLGPVKTVIAGYESHEAELKYESDGLYKGELSGDFGTIEGKRITIEAKSFGGQVFIKNFEIAPMLSAGPSSLHLAPFQSEAKLSNTLKVIYSVFAGFFLIFLIIDSVIIWRNRIERKGPSSSPHLLVLLLFAIVNIISLYSL
jgi:hypothetical protein